MRGELFIVSAPSGAGKTTLIRGMFERYPALAERLTFSVSHTTRPPREGEVDGRDYHFIGREEFKAMLDAGAFLEWAVVHAQDYGTSRAAVEQALERGSDAILEVDVQGAEQVRQHYPRAPSIFIMPPSYEVLERRLRGRGLDSPEQIERRLRTALQELRQYGSYEYVIVNQDLDRACESLAAVFLARRCRRQRTQDRIDRILEQFPPLAEPRDAGTPESGTADRGPRSATDKRQLA